MREDEARPQHNKMLKLHLKSQPATELQPDHQRGKCHAGLDQAKTSQQCSRSLADGAFMTDSSHHIAQAKASCWRAERARKTALKQISSAREKVLSTEKAGVTAIEGKKPLGNFQSAGRSAAEVLSDAINLVDAGEDQRITIGKLPNSAITARGNGAVLRWTENGSGVTPFIQGTRYSGKVIDIEAKALQSFEGPDTLL